MKNHYLLSLLAVIVIGSNAFAQAPTVNICTGTAACLNSNVIGGTYQWQASSDNVVWTDIPGGTSANYCFTPATSGLFYRAQVTTACGPVFSDTIKLVLLANPTANAGPDISGTCLDTVSLGGSPAGSGGTGPYTFAWSSAPNISSTTIANPDLNGVTFDGVVVLTVTDANGCIGTDTISVVKAPYSVTFDYTGGIQNFTPNPCFTGDTIYIQCWAGQGGTGADGGSSSGNTAGGTGGLGAYAEGYLVAGNQLLNIFVGGQGTTPSGGFNGGGNGGSQNAGGGGGASDVRLTGTAEVDRIITAGGGGGGGRGGCESANTIVGGNGGSGGGLDGANGIDAPTSGGSAGGGGGGFGTGVGGAAGVGCGGFLGSPGSTTTNSVGGNGGAGQSCCCFSFSSIPGGGGGGGGQVGGGGGGGGSAGTTGCSGNDKGAGGGGGGGTSYTGGVLNGSTTQGVWSGDGRVIITINP